MIDDLRDRLEALATALLGEPNRAASSKRELRFGTKGSLSIVRTGEKRGVWFDHEAGSGGGPLALIQHARGCDAEAAVAWARQWLGQPETTPKPAPRRVTAPEPEADKTAIARKLWLEAGPLTGTLGERYLNGARAIPTPPNGWPGTVIRWHAKRRAVVVAATTDDGTVQAVQLIRVRRDGQKATEGGPAKVSYGPQAGAVVRLPGDPAGPLLLAEGPETGLAAWRATAHETWVALGSMAKAEPPIGRRVVVCADDDPRRAGPGRSAEAFERIRTALAAWRADGRDVVVAYPWAKRRHDKSDMNDVLRAEGLEAVAARINLALRPAIEAPHRVTLAEGRAVLNAAMAGFVAAAEAWRDGDDPPPRHAIRVDVGVGKSEAARRAIARMLRDMRDRGDRRTIAIAVPTHALGEEQAERFAALPEAAGLVVRVWRGREANDPSEPGAKMCQDLEAVEDAQRVGENPQSAVCRRRMPDGVVLACPFFEACGYQRQRAQRADLWLTAHNLLFSAKPEALGNLAAVVIDESFLKAGLDEKGEKFPVELLGKAAPIEGDPLGAQRLEFLRRRVLDAIHRHEPGPLRRDVIAAADLTPESCAEARGLEFQRKADSGITPNMPRAARRAAVEAAAENRQALVLGRFWQRLGGLLAAGGPEASGWLAIGRDGDNVVQIRSKGRHEIRAGWQVPTLVLDATLNLGLIRPFLPNIRLTADVSVAAPHQRVRQVTDRAFALSRLAPPDSEAAAAKPEEARRRQNRLAELRDRIILEARNVAPGRMLVAAQKAVKAELIAMGLPTNVATIHHNGARGVDAYGDVRALIVIGRTEPRPGAVTAMAEALTGAHVPLLTEWYDRADAARELIDGAELAEADRHPDPLCEAIRWQACEGELLQIIGRGRGVNRTADNPLDVVAMTDVPLPLPIAGTLSADRVPVGLSGRMLAAGGVALSNPTHAHLAYPGMWPTDRAAAKAFGRAKVATNPYVECLIGECRNLPVRVAYQRAGRGQQPAVAWFDPRLVPDIAAWLTQSVGLLAWCHIEVDTIEAKPVPVPIDLRGRAETGHEPRAITSEARDPEPVLTPISRDPAPPALPVTTAGVAADDPPSCGDIDPAGLYGDLIRDPTSLDVLTIRKPGLAVEIETSAASPLMLAEAVQSDGLRVPLLLTRPRRSDWAIPPPGAMPSNHAFMVAR